VSGALTAVKVVGVFLLLAATLMYIRRHDRGRLRGARKSQRPVSVLGQARLSKAASVAVVDIGGTAYAVAVTDQRVSLLLQDPVELPEIEPAASPAAQAVAPVSEESAADEPQTPAKGRYVGRYERAARTTSATGAQRPSFGEALVQQFRVLTRRETAVPLSELPLSELPLSELPLSELPLQGAGAHEATDFDAELARLDDERNDDLNSVTMLIPAVTPAADGSAADTAARTPGNIPG
jgi:flagellar biogenesis protein FliO